MLINLRNALMSGKRLPYDAEVEFLESTGTQYIDTRVVPDNSTGFTVDAMAIGAVPNLRILGVYETISGVQQRFAAAVRSGGNGVDYRQFYFGWGAAYNFTASKTNFMTRRVMGLNFLNSRSMTFDGVVVSSNLPTLATFTTSAWLFGNRGTADLAAQRIYQCQMSSGTNLVRDFIPVRKGTVGYLYDRVSGKLFGNAGTGDFVLGPDVVPVEYIESHGTEWIDTGFKTTSDSTIEISAAVSNFVNGNIIFGSKGTDATTLIRLLEYIRNEVSILSLQSGAFGVTAGGYITADTNFHKYLITPSGASIDDSIGYQKSRTSNTETNFVLFAYVSATDPNNRLYSQSKIAYAKILQGTTPVRSFRPVRVGTDATSWEGAMMDVLTRRIYRNAGTGAFTYGNDLKYPIPAA